MSADIAIETDPDFEKVCIGFVKMWKQVNEALSPREEEDDEPLGSK